MSVFALMGGWSLLTDTGNFKRAGVPILRLMNVLFVVVLVLSPKDGARARARLGWRFDYDYEHHFIEHEHEQCG
jgi:hypothetical protein